MVIDPSARCFANCFKVSRKLRDLYPPPCLVNFRSESCSGPMTTTQHPLSIRNTSIRFKRTKGCGLGLLGCAMSVEHFRGQTAFSILGYRVRARTNHDNSLRRDSMHKWHSTFHSRSRSGLVTMCNVHVHRHNSMKQTYDDPASCAYKEDTTRAITNFVRLPVKLLFNQCL